MHKLLENGTQYVFPRNPIKQEWMIENIINLQVLFHSSVPRTVPGYARRFFQDKFQLSEIDETLKTTRIYYEKNLQGDVTGLLDARGAEIASYTYDAWENVITDTEKSFYYEGYEVPFELNHVLYRGYYYDGSCTDTESDTNLYYLQSRYYDAEVGRIFEEKFGEKVYE